MIGTFLNVSAVLFGGVAGLITGRNLTAGVQNQARLWTTALAVLIAGWVFWKGIHPPFGHATRQVLIALAALSLGSLLGHLLGLQRQLNRLVRWASSGEPADAGAHSALAVQAIVFSANPLGIIGAILEGASGLWQLLALKALLDGLAALGFAAAGSRNVLLAAVPLAAFQGTLTLLARAVCSRGVSPELLASLQMTSGLLVLVMAPVLFGWRQVPLANYLPALVLGPALTAFLI